jgi:hypothetical protein
MVEHLIITRGLLKSYNIFTVVEFFLSLSQAMEVCIDPALLSFNKTANADVDPIIAKLTSLGVSYSLQTQPIPECITWKRATVEHKVGDNLEVSY